MASYLLLIQSRYRMLSEGIKNSLHLSRVKAGGLKSLASIGLILCP